jgi:hypothetical protein
MYVEEYNKLILKQESVALSWSNAKIVLRCTVNKTSKSPSLLAEILADIRTRDLLSQKETR